MVVETAKKEPLLIDALYLSRAAMQILHWGPTGGRAGGGGGGGAGGKEMPGIAWQGVGSERQERKRKSLRTA